ncbi:MAG TPA: L,D-transpeptidase [Trebonia sp.]
MAVASVAVLAAAAVAVSRPGHVPAAASGGSAPGARAMLDAEAMRHARAAAESRALTGSSAQPAGAGRADLAAGSGAAATPAGVTVTLALRPLSRQVCPVTAAACVDLANHLTWLQSGGQITYGPVRMEPGPPGSPHATPRGTFHVSWKGGPGLISNVYGEPMPYAVFFAPGGIAFHGGSLTVPSHGCVHLTIVNARYYHDHLPIGAEVVVF